MSTFTAWSQAPFEHTSCWPSLGLSVLTAGDSVGLGPLEPQPSSPSPAGWPEHRRLVQEPVNTRLHAEPVFSLERASSHLAVESLERIPSVTPSHLLPLLPDSQ